jgi:hypothetical protein
VSVVVSPAEFTLVLFDAGRIAEIVADVASRLGLAADVEVTVNVEEQNPLAATALVSVDPIVLNIEGGAFEEPRKPRQLSENGVAVAAARLLGRAVDRRNPAFGSPPPEAELTLHQADAWDASTLGRAERLGLEVHQSRWRYRFRTRHGFNDVSDRVFDRLWATDGLTWADLEAGCAETEGAKAAAAPVS